MSDNSILIMMGKGCLRGDLPTIMDMWEKTHDLEIEVTEEDGVDMYRMWGTPIGEEECE